jgi:hypothetical protein
VHFFLDGDAVPVQRGPNIELPADPDPAWTPAGC